MTTAPVTDRLYGKGHASPGKKCHHLHEYRLSCHQYEELRDRASEFCEICGIDEEHVYRELLHIDHCHETGKPRGLLCAKCNAVMACFDGRKTWGANRRWERQAALYAELFKLWDAYGRVTDRLGTDRTADLVDHVRATIKKHGDTRDHADLTAAEAELAERRSRKGGRPPKA